MATIITIFIFSCVFCSGWSQENDSDDLPSYQARNNFRDHSCFQSTKEKDSYFVNPANFENQCSLIVTPYSENVCQIRLEFEQFSIAQPTQLIPGNANGPFPTAGSSYQCNVDEFKVGTLFGTMNLGFQHLCGENEGQHIYIPITQTTGAISLNFALSHRTSGGNIAPKVPRWRIKITQLECLSASDSALIAPPGCLQYYPERTGAYESFNYNNNFGPYIGQMSYAICFRRTPDICGIRHTSVNFLMNFAGTATPGTGAATSDNTICIGTGPGVPNADVAAASEDYILIPGGRYPIPGTTTNIARDIFCDSMLPTGTVVTSSAPGPLYVGVSHDVRDPALLTGGSEQGFRFNYQLLNVGCQTFSNRFIPITETGDEE